MVEGSFPGRDIVHRWEGNPLIHIDDLEFRCSDVQNAGVALYKNEELLLVTIESLEGIRRIHLARKGEGGDFHVDRDPFLFPSDDPRFKEHESRGVLDARVTFFDDTFYVMYVADGNHGYRIGLATTHDFNDVERIGHISEPDTKGGALFPQKINNRFARIERPGEGRSLWISYSDDLIHWGKTDIVITPRDGFWDASWVGVGAPPIETEGGWLVIYYGAKATSSGPIYRLGAMLLNKKHPTRVLERTNTPILSPRETYERIGDLPNIVFTTGALLLDDGTLKIYYGAADSCICIGTTSIDKIITHCRESKGEF